MKEDESSTLPLAASADAPSTQRSRPEPMAVPDDPLGDYNRRSIAEMIIPDPFGSESMGTCPDSLKNSLELIGVGESEQMHATVYNSTQAGFYCFLSTVIGFLINVICGILTALLIFIDVYIWKPLIRVVGCIIFAGPGKLLVPLYTCLVDLYYVFISRICAGFGNCFSRISVKYTPVATASPVDTEV